MPSEFKFAKRNGIEPIVHVDIRRIETISVSTAERKKHVFVDFIGISGSIAPTIWSS